jgi:hypothetical protein
LKALVYFDHRLQFLDAKHREKGAEEMLTHFEPHSKPHFLDGPSLVRRAAIEFEFDNVPFPAQGKVQVSFI